MTETITAQEAWEAVERLQLDVTYNHKSNSWCASIYEPKVEIGWGDTPTEAVAQLRQRIGEVASAISG